MIVIKSNKQYQVAELQNKWRISSKCGNMPVDYEISKKDCPTFDDVKAYILNNNIF